MHNPSTRSNKFLLLHPFVITFFLSTVIVFISCGPEPTTAHYGFLTMLGNDTISIESVTRKGNTLTSDEVDRFPRVRVRHTVVELNDDGSIKHLEMTIHTPSEPANEQDRTVVASVSNSEVNLSKKDGTGTVKREFA
ncbi:MAG TPA: hypothetical protein VG676_16365, partial [Chitinophagaceae bacterium]|nr:hypothetical protein [Chitinophagaceae bacterium]